jgi:hypothetical protein
MLISLVSHPNGESSPQRRICQVEEINRLIFSLFLVCLLCRGRECKSDSRLFRNDLDFLTVPLTYAHQASELYASGATEGSH